jgi:hypothetical protein
MTCNPKLENRFPSLAAFGDELLRVARADSHGGRRSSLKRVAVALGVTLVVVPAGLALALPHEELSHSQSGSATTPVAALTPAETEAIRKAFEDTDSRVCVAVGPDATPTCGPVIPEREAAGLGLVPPASEAEETDFMAEGAPAWLVDDCRAGGAEAPSTALHCKAIIAIAEGRLEPGSYSDEELREALGD